MASGIITGSTSNKYITCRLVWSATANTNGNYSDVTATLQYCRTNSGYTTYGTLGSSININGNTASFSKRISIGSGWVTAWSRTVRVDHDSSGSKACWIGASGSINGTSLKSTSIGATVSLDTIQRISGMSLSKTEVNLGDTFTVTINAHNSSFSHWIDITGIGDQITYEVAAGTTSCDCTIPTSRQSTFKSGNQLTATVWLNTKTGSGHDTKLGVVSQNITVKAPDKPKDVPVDVKVDENAAALYDSRFLRRPTVRVYDVKDDKLELIGIVNTTTSIIWKRSWSNYGDFEIHMGAPDDLLKAGRFVMVNNDVRKFGIIEKVVDDSDGYLYNSTQDFTVYGYTADFLLSYRITIPSDSDNANHDGYMVYDKTPAETIMYDIVDKQVINPPDSKRKIPLITLAAHDEPSGHELSFQSRFKLITADLNTLSVNSGLGFGLIPDFDTGKLVFTVLHGTDRTQHIETYSATGVESATINPNAYIFSLNNKTVKKHAYTHDASAYKSMAYVAGEGDGAKRKIVKVGDDMTDLDRREVLVDARDIQKKYSSTTDVVTGYLTSGSDETSSTTGDSQEKERTDAEVTQLMQDRGNTKLQTEHRDVSSYEYNVFTTDYRLYWDLGDTCTYIDKENNLTLEKQVTAVEETYEGGDITVTPTFGYTETTVSGALTSAQEASTTERTGVSKELSQINANVMNTNELFAKHAYIMGLDVDELTTKVLEAEMADFTNMTARRVSTNKLIANEASITDLVAKKASIDDLTAKQANIDALAAKSADITALAAEKADIDDLTAEKADILAVSAKKADIETLSAQTANITKLFSDTASFDEATVGKLWSSLANIKTLLSNRLLAGEANIDDLTADQLKVINGWITSAMIESLTADKITAGSLDTSKVTIQSSDGALKISGPTLQISDKNSVVRVQLGRDASGNFTFVLYDSTGKGVLIDADGIKPASVPNGLIVDKMVADDANISGSKLDIDSVVESINNGTKTLNMAKIYLDSDNGTLSELLARVDEDGGFATTNQLTQTSDKLTSSISRTYETQQNLDSRITANEQNIKTVTESQTTLTQTTDGLSASVSSLTKTTTDQGATLDQISKSLKFDETGLNLSDGGNGASVNLNETKMTFKNAAGQATATFSEDVEIKDLKIKYGGTFTMGNFAWVPRSNGNLSIKYIGGDS